VALRRALRALHGALTAPPPAPGPEALDPELVAAFTPLFDRLLSLYFRLEVEGLEHLPEGPALLVGNHNSGITFLDPFGLGARWYRARGTGDPLYFLLHDMMLRLPQLGPLLRRIGGLRADPVAAAGALAAGHKVLVTPGGNLEAFRSYRQRNRVVFGGRKGWARLALRSQVPVVPVLFMGGHETFFVLHDGQGLARALGLDRRLRCDTWPLFVGLPWGLALGPLFHLPLPARIQVRVLPPLDLSPYGGAAAADDPQVLDELYARVTGDLQRAMDQAAAARRRPVLG